ncbi:hypothetical protein FHR32_007156 [Streptosporangium album]|uniref:Uncharacterized protein n=1 Tax=Streptosporangium album TaxID=47479 RepID=A0A7W7S2N4_9ACTN|nr:hypothetical protein [Streptosporangium album]MBB4942756.1 hypothetical protein [Streptosporangium album]
MTNWPYRGDLAQVERNGRDGAAAVDDRSPAAAGGHVDGDTRQAQALEVARDRALGEVEVPGERCEADPGRAGMQSFDEVPALDPAQRQVVVAVRG